jgi:hypothetical protein
VTIAAGQTSAVIAITTEGLPLDTTVTFTAVYGPAEVTAELLITSDAQALYLPAIVR